MLSCYGNPLAGCGNLRGHINDNIGTNGRARKENNTAHYTADETYENKESDKRVFSYKIKKIHRLLILILGSLMI